MVRRKGAPLTAAFVRTVTRPGRYGDGRGGHGLSLLVKRMKSSGRVSRSWSVRVYDPATKRQTSMGIGPFPLVTLAEAREQAVEIHRAVRAGRDPRDGVGEVTFRAATERVIALHEPGWKAGSRIGISWRNSFERHLFPTLGDTPVGEITSGDLLAVLEPVWGEKPAAAKVLKTRIGTVFSWARAKGLRTDDPIPALTAALPRHGRVRHHRALPASEVRAALDTVDGSGASPAVRLLTRWLALTACRTIEGRGARWSEIDTATATWTIPASRMKVGREHRIPLSPQALHVLAEARDRWDDTGLIFPGQTGRPVSHSTVAGLFRSLQLACSPHGLRASFRTWCGETGVPREVAEAALAHTVGGVEAAYSRGDYLERRRPVMHDWAQVVTH
ncbi:tyrosine-type recombinase/integrase [Candidatus Spongiisocius sp.]|uniref:tyrosine-type recombinase/integrase n=1 Tax=Candidatus Spongiisocius sp. TaxID=3101273 RepID=UPI003B5A177E